MKAGQTSNLRTKYLQAADMVDRYEKMQVPEKTAFEESLRANPKLRDFLAKAILHLKLYGNEGSINHDIAHFLMGDFSGEQLPQELATWLRNNKFQPTPDLREKLNDLLRTFQKGWSKEDFIKTIHKLEFLAAEVEKIVDTSFSGGTAGGINQDAVEKWMFEGEQNLWIAKSKIQRRDLNSIQPKTNIDDL